jgi:hypothetical protein
MADDNFVTPIGTVRASHVIRPFRSQFGEIWFTDVAFDPPWPVGAPGGTLKGLIRFVSRTAPIIHDDAGTPYMAAEELEPGARIRVSGSWVKQGRRAILTMNTVRVVEVVQTSNISHDVGQPHAIVASGVPHHASMQVAH